MDSYKKKQLKQERQTRKEAALNQAPIPEISPQAGHPPPPAAAPPMPGTRAQRQASAALAKIKAVEPGQRRDYKARADGFPVMVMQAGLAQAVGFHFAKRQGKHAHGLYLEDFAQALIGENGEALLKRAIDAPLAEYRRLTREALALAEWFKRFAQAWPAETKEAEK
ncbi:MAG: type III-B CRISPR module-associated protein Cmr5 [Pseudomonadota bacterium]|nr:type III-B CRISPR module-associated protein Cmr5 [Pseudomonadota bacterium]